jgi:hypothetical protein
MAKPLNNPPTCAALSTPLFIPYTRLYTTNEYDLSPETHNKADKLLSYIELRKKQIELIKEITETNKTDELLPQLIEARQKADDAFAEVLKL